MGHKITWYHENRVLLIDYIGDLDKDEILEINAELEKHLGEGQAPVHLISDNLKMGKAELTLKSAIHAFGAMKKPGWGWVVLIGLNSLIRFFAEIFSKQFGLKIRIATSQEEAFEILKRLDLSLAPAAEKAEPVVQ